MATEGGDPSGIVHNPATLSLGNGNEITGGLTGLITRQRFEPDPEAARTVLGTPLTGGDGGEAGRSGAIPNLFAGVTVTPGLRAGLAITSLYGGGTYWKEGWVGRYDRLNSELLTSALQPTLAWQPAPWLYVGAGAIIQFAQVRATAALDFGTMDGLLAGGAFGGVPAGSDGTIRTKGQGFASGFTLGAILEPLAGTRIGIAFRSAMTHPIEGTTRFELQGSVGAGLSTASGAFVTTRSTLRLPLPAGITVGAEQQIGARVTLMGGVQWVGWSRQTELRASYANPAQPSVAVGTSWHDTYFFSLGARYVANERWTFRAGVAYEQAPTPGATRTQSFLDALADAVWLTMGARYALTADTIFDAALGYVAPRDRAVVLRASDPNGALRGSVSGTTRDGGTTFFAVQLTSRF